MKQSNQTNQERRDNPNPTAGQTEDAGDLALSPAQDNMITGDAPKCAESAQPVGTSAQALADRMQNIADRPVSFQDRMKGMREFYETKSFHQNRPAEPLEIPEDEE
jgi:hypothetical protein